MITRIIPAAIALFVAALLQTALAPHMAIGGVTPNFLVIVVVTIALATGPNEGAAVGFIAGLTFDLLGTAALGPMTLVLTLAGYFAGMLHAAMFAEGWLLPLTVLAATALMTEVTYAILLGLLGVDVPFWRTFFTRMLPAAVYNTALALLVYSWLARFLRQERPMRTFRRLG